MYTYMEKIIEAEKHAAKLNEKSIPLAVKAFAQAMKEDKLIHTFGTGHSHMIGIELFARAGGLGNVDAMLDPSTLTAFGAKRSGRLEQTSGLSDIVFEQYEMTAGDVIVIISNSGRNAMPIEMAMKARENGLCVIVVTSLIASKAQPSRHISGKRLFELADIVLDTGIAMGDSLVNMDGLLSGPGSSIVSMFLLNTVVCEAIAMVKKEGIQPYVFQSQNVDGFDNDAIYEHFKGRIKHF